MNWSDSVRSQMYQNEQKMLSKPNKDVYTRNIVNKYIYFFIHLNVFASLRVAFIHRFHCYGGIIFVDILKMALYHRERREDGQWEQKQKCSIVCSYFLSIFSPSLYRFWFEWKKIYIKFYWIQYVNLVRCVL